LNEKVICCRIRSWFLKGLKEQCFSICLYKFTNTVCTWNSREGDDRLSASHSKEHKIRNDRKVL